MIGADAEHKRQRPELELAMELLLSFLLGVAASALFWWVQNHYVVPRVVFSDGISKQRTDDSPSGVRYRIKLVNNGKRRAIDLEVIARLRIKGLRPEFPGNWEVIDLAMYVDRQPFVSPSRNFVARFYPEGTEKFASSLFPQAIIDKKRQRLLTLEDVMQLGNNADLMLVVFCYDEFSGARKMFHTRRFTREDIVELPFRTEDVQFKKS